MTLNCSVCGQSVSNASTFCEHCGFRVRAQRRGASVGNVVGAVCVGIVCLPSGARAVMGLGSAISSGANNELLVPMVEMGVVGLGVFALGIFGIHKLLNPDK